MPSFFTLLFLTASTLNAADLRPGVVIASVAVRGSPQQTYALYVPTKYSPDRAWPILYCLDPRARGDAPVERFAQAAERAGFIVAGSNNSRNGPMGPVQKAISAMFVDTHERLAIDDARVYAAGFSGGSRVALSWALTGRLAGVVACGAAFGQAGMPKKLQFQLFLAAGVDDFNHDEIRDASLTLAKRNVPHRYAVFDGDHEWLPADLAAEALEFFGGRVPPQAATDSKAERKQAEQYQQLSGQVASLSGRDRRSFVEGLRKKASRDEDSPDRRVARRVLGATFITALEQARPLIEARQYQRAADIYAVATLARPGNAEVRFGLARAQAGAGLHKEALQSLEQAVASGFKDRERIEQDPLFQRLRDDSRFRTIVETIHD